MACPFPWLLLAVYFHRGISIFQRLITAEISILGGYKRGSRKRKNTVAKFIAGSPYFARKGKADSVAGEVSPLRWLSLCTGGSERSPGAGAVARYVKRT